MGRLTGICVDPSWTHRQCLDALRAQFSGQLGDEHIHASLADGISHHGGNASDTSEFHVSTWTGDEDDLLLLAATDEIEEGVDDVDVAGQVCFDLCLQNSTFAHYREMRHLEGIIRSR